MRKFMQLFALAFFALGSMVPNMALAQSIEEANHKDIAMLLDAASGRNSAYAASLIGETRGRVYIEYVTRIHASSFFSKEPKRVVYWMPRSELTDEQLTQFRTFKERFRVFDALAMLKPGMTQGEAESVITSFGFERRAVANRPAVGWAGRDGTQENIQGRASESERRHQKQLLVAEWWRPIGNGQFGGSALYLFYGSDGRLIEALPVG